MTDASRYPSYRAPKTDRQILCVPPWPALSEQLAKKPDALQIGEGEILGKPLAELASEARHALIYEAQSYTSTYCDPTMTADETRPLILTGHQPELVHPGVWLKNFAASQLAKQVGGAAISLVIDNDLCRMPSIRVPTGSIEQPQVVDVPFDRPLDDMPYEERSIADDSLWSSFGERATQTIAPLISNPLLGEWWQDVLSISESTSKTGASFAQARHRLEHRWGSCTLEVPQSQICQTKPFRCFLLHLLTNAARLRQDYNNALGEYRAVHRLRSAAQPLPNLTEIDGWIETPFWIWTQDNPVRRPLFVQPHQEGLLVSDREQWQDALTISDNSADLALQQLDDWESAGIKVRTRALVTTLYARLLLSDVFIHGIGGAKYDQVTDAICQSFFGMQPPSYATLSGTLHLPIEHDMIAETRLAELRQTLRSLRYHPERYLPQSSSHQEKFEPWVKQKEQWFKTAKTPENAAQRHTKIIEANEALQPAVLPQKEKYEQELSATIAQIRANQLLESREYPFCLFPPEHLQDFLLDFSR